MIEYRIQNNIGKAKYVVSWHDGVKKHKDGSKFFDMAIFKSKVKMNEFIQELVQREHKLQKVTHGYVIQQFDKEGKCTGQEFVTGDQVEFEDGNGKPVDEFKHYYHSYDMVQPKG